jgi:hypothetical protein
LAVSVRGAICGRPRSQCSWCCCTTTSAQRASAGHTRADLERSRRSARSCRRRSMPPEVASGGAATGRPRRCRNARGGTQSRAGRTPWAPPGGGCPPSMMGRSLIGAPTLRHRCAWV